MPDDRLDQVTGIIGVDVPRQRDTLRCHDVEGEAVSLGGGAKIRLVLPVLGGMRVELPSFVDDGTPRLNALADAAVIVVGDRLIKRLEQARGVVRRKIDSHVSLPFPELCEPGGRATIAQSGFGELVAMVFTAPP